LNGSRLSKRYAKALFSLGQEDGNYDQYGRNLVEFAEFCQQHADFRQVIANPVFAVEDRKRILQSVLEKSGFSDMVKNFLYLLLEKDRIGAIESITAYYAKLTDDISNVARAEVITARPLKEESLARIEGSLERLTSKKIRSEVKEDRELIGGVVVKIGDMVLDGSVKAQIEGLKESF
jgi:F-type H+-transporting ATPase subunit delta